jgi:hypothetical protein
VYSGKIMRTFRVNILLTASGSKNKTGILKRSNFHVLLCDFVYIGETSPTFRRNRASPSSESKSKRSKQGGRRRRPYAVACFLLNAGGRLANCTPNATSQVINSSRGIQRHVILCEPTFRRNVSPPSSG